MSHSIRCILNMNPGTFVITSVMLGVGLAMDAFSVSVANGLNDPEMTEKRMGLIAGTFAFFQFLMPMVGWICVHTIVTYFKAVQPLIPWIALFLLCYIGSKMIYEGMKESQEDEVKPKPVSKNELIVQGIATSIDALSVGFTIADYDALAAFVCSLIIALVTFGICIAGVRAGRSAGTKLTGKTSVLGGVILIVIGIEIVLMH